MNRRVQRLAATIMTMALVVAACASDGDDTEANDGGSTTSASASPTTSPPDTTAETATSTAEPQELPDSFRGVTATAIKVGVAVPDFDALQAAGIANYQGDAEVAFSAFFDQINASGGIFGRQIEPVYEGFEFTDSTTQDAACVKLTEDHEVFIVLYGLLGPNNICLTDQHDTMVMTRSFQTADLREQSGDTVWLQLNAADDERTRIMGEVVAESGRLDGKTIGILANASTSEGSDGEVLQATLDALGFESTLQITEGPGGDPIAREADLGIVAERFQADGVNFVFELGGGGNAADVFAGSGFTPEWAYKALGASVDGAQDRSLLDGAITVAEVNEQFMIEDDDFQTNCMDVVREANPDLVDEMSFLPSGDQQAEGQPNWVNPVMIACDQTRLLAALGEIAGADLTNDSFRAALDELGPFDLYGYGQASFGSEAKWDGLDEFFIQEYEFETETIAIVGEAIVVDR
ncbi:MAG: ABC transporter substrate-binding protein [Acidimicrobiales bacterium]